MTSDAGITSTALRTHPARMDLNHDILLVVANTVGPRLRSLVPLVNNENVLTYETRECLSVKRAGAEKKVAIDVEMERDLVTPKRTTIFLKPQLKKFSFSEAIDVRGNFPGLRKQGDDRGCFTHSRRFHGDRGPRSWRLRLY